MDYSTDGSETLTDSTSSKWQDHHHQSQMLYPAKLVLLLPNSFHLTDCLRLCWIVGQSSWKLQMSNDITQPCIGDQSNFEKFYSNVTRCNCITQFFISYAFTLNNFFKQKDWLYFLILLETIVMLHQKPFEKKQALLVRIVSAH